MSLGITGIAVTVVEGDRAVGLDPRKGWDGVVAILFDEWWRLSMALLATSSAADAAGWWSPVRRGRPCHAVGLSQDSWAGGVHVVRSAPQPLRIAVH